MNFLTFLLQTPAPELLPPSDSIKNHLIHTAEVIATTPKEELFSQMVSKALNFGVKVLAALAIYIVGAWLIKKIKNLLSGYFTRRNTDAALASFVMSLVSIGATILLIILTVGTLGVNTTSLAALLAAGGMAIGMALSGTVQNFAGGIMIIVFKPFKVGDYIEAQGFAGTVIEVNIVSTKLTTVDNKVIVIPNGALSNGTINNYSHMPLRRVDWTVDVEYGTSSEEAKAVIMEIVSADSRVLTTESGAPADPFVALAELRDSSIQFVVRAWVKSEDYWGVKFDITGNIYTILPQRGIQFPFPQLDVTIKK